MARTQYPVLRVVGHNGRCTHPRRQSERHQILVLIELRDDLLEDFVG